VDRPIVFHKLESVIVDLRTKQLETAARVLFLGATTSERQTCHVDDDDEDINNNVVLDPGTLDAANHPSVDELDQQVAHFEASGIWEPLPALSSRVNASPEVGVLLAGAIGGSPPEVGVLLTGARTTRRKSSQRVQFSSKCECDECPDTAVANVRGVSPTHSYEHSREVRHAAMVNYLKFHRIEEVDEKKIAKSALGITGWAFTHVRDWIDVDLKVEDEDDRQSSCVSIRTYEPNETPTETETTDTIAAIRRSRVRNLVRDSVGHEKFDLLTSIGAIEQVLDSVEAHIMTTDDESDVLGVDTWIDTEIEITLDSGCCEHVMDLGDAPGYGAFIVESAGSKRRQNFVVGNGQRVPNEGQIVLNLEGDLGLQSGKRKMTSTFQVAEVTRPLMSVSRVCDKGMRCIFEDTHALIIDKKTGREVAKFERQGGLYIARMKLKPPEGFAGPAPP
jgi:hypothetical protein